MTTTFRSIGNRAVTQLTALVHAADTSFSVTPGTGTLFPASNFLITVENEHMLCTSRVGDTFTVTRAQEGTTAVDHAAGSSVEVRIVASLFTDVYTTINNIETGVDDLTTYLKLAGRSGGQAASGGTAASDNLDLASTAHATKGYVRMLDRLLYSPGSTQVIALSTDVISPSASALVRISNTTAGTVTLASTPTIAAGSNGQVLEVMSVGTDPVVVQDKGTLVGSGLDLGGQTTFTLKAGTVTQFRYSSDLAAWVLAGGGASGGSGGSGGLHTVQAGPVQVEWTNQPAALTELYGLTVHRSKIDLTQASTVRLVADVLTAGAATARLRAQYSTDSGATWHYLDGATGPEADISATGVAVSAKVNLENAAKADVLVRVVGINGDGAADPVLGLIQLQFDNIGGGAPLVILQEIDAVPTTTPTTIKVTNTTLTDLGGGVVQLDIAPSASRFVLTKADATLPNATTKQWLGNAFGVDYPTSPNTMDDEFDDSTGMSGAVNGLNARWTWFNMGTSTATYGTQGYVQLTPVGIQWVGITQPVPVGTYTFEAKFSLVSGTTSDCVAGIVLRDGVGGDFYTFQAGYFTAASFFRIEVNRWNSPSSFNSNLVSLGSNPGLTSFWIRAVWDGANLSAYYSTDGLGWSVYKTGFADLVGVTQVGLAVLHPSGTGGSVFVDYFRRIA